MTTWSTRIDRYGKCPCGKGEVCAEIESPEDSGYGRAQVRNFIEGCSECADRYRIINSFDGVFLVTKAEPRQRIRIS